MNAVMIAESTSAIGWAYKIGFIMVFVLSLPGFLQVTGVWLAIPLAELLTFMLTTYLVFRHCKHYKYL